MSKEALIEALNEQLAAEYMAVIQYLQYAAVVTGPHRPELADFFKMEIVGEIAHAQYIADKVAALGGTPTTVPKPVKHATDARELLQNVLEAETWAVQNYDRLIKLADENGESGIRIQMENFLVEENTHRDEVTKILHGKW